MSNQNLTAYFQRLSKAFLMPIALLSIASLMLGVSSLFLWHEQLRAAFPIITSPFIQYPAKLLDTAASVVMSNLPILYSVAIGYSMAKEDREYAAFGTLVGYLAFLGGMGFLINFDSSLRHALPNGAITQVLGITTINTGIFGAIMVGLLSAAIHNKVHKIKFPMALAFYGGVRFVPIATSLFFVALGQVFPFLWTYISNFINVIALGVTKAGIFGPFLYQVGERLLIPTGLHQIWNTVIRDTAVSGIYQFSEPFGTIEGARGAFNAYMATNKLPAGTSLVDMVKFLRGGQIPITVFALPAAALAMYHCADEDKKESVKALFITAAFTSIIAGITEPLEFAFLFVAPGLYLVYSLLTGISYLLAYIFGSTLGGTEASALGLTLFGFFRTDSHWWIVCIIGICLAPIFYFLFRWWIIHFDVKTPGRGGDYDNSLSYLDSGTPAATTDPRVLKAQLIIKGLGGVSNIQSLENCMSRLRVTIANIDKVDENMLKATGSHAIIKIDTNNIQIVYGTTVGIVCESVRKEMTKQSN